MINYEVYLRRKNSQIPKINTEIFEKGEDIPLSEVLRIEDKNQLLKEEERLEKLKIAKEKLEQFKLTKPIKIAEKAITKPIVGAGAGAAIGAVAGGTLGVAGKLAGVMIAVNGGWILAPIGAALGYLGIKAFSKKNKKD